MKEYAIRIWLQPDRLASAGLTPMDVASAVREQNSQFSTGRIGEEPMPRIVDETISITTQGRLSDPKEFEQIRSEEHTSELQSLMRISYAVFCLQKKKNT